LIQKKPKRDRGCGIVRFGKAQKFLGANQQLLAITARAICFHVLIKRKSVTPKFREFYISNFINHQEWAFRFAVEQWAALKPNAGAGSVSKLPLHP
jgi:hypothetical protein